MPEVCTVGVRVSTHTHGCRSLPRPPEQQSEHTALRGSVRFPTRVTPSLRSPCVPPQLDYIDARAVQLGSLLVRGLTTLVLVNSACGFPWRMSDFMPWNVFDGKLFHQKYLQSEKGCTVEALVEQNVSPWWFPVQK